MFSPRRDDDELEVREKEALEVRDGKSGIKHAVCGSGGERSPDLLETSSTKLHRLFCGTKHSSFWSSLFICLVFARELVPASIEVSAYFPLVDSLFVCSRHRLFLFVRRFICQDRKVILSVFYADSEKSPQNRMLVRRSRYRGFAALDLPGNPVCARHVDSSTSAFSLSSHRPSFTSLLFSSRFLDS